MRLAFALVCAATAACGGTVTGQQGPPADAAMVGDGGLKVLGPEHQGQYQLGPVEWKDSFPNACGQPYPDQIQQIEGGMLAGLDNSVAAAGDYCDACVWIKTARGHEAVLRVVTYGVSNGPGDMDVSKAAFDAITEGEYPRTMTWRLVQCPTSAPLYFQYQTGANVDWTSLWVRNPSEKVDKVEVKSKKHADWFALRRETDGTLNDDGGFGAGAFTIRVTGVDGKTFEQTFPSFTPGALVAGSGNLP